MRSNFSFRDDGCGSFEVEPLKVSQLVRRLTLTISFLFSLLCVSFGQTCLQKLDSARNFARSNPEKTNFYASELLADLDSGYCNPDIGIAGVYNNVGLLFWEINEKGRALDACLKGLANQLQFKDTTDVALLGMYYNLSRFYQEIGSYEEATRYLDYAGGVADAYDGANSTNLRLTYLLRRGIFKRETGKYLLSIEALQEASNIEDADDSTSIVVQIELGTTYRYAGNLDESERILLDAMERAKDRKILYHIAVDRIATVKMEQGEYSDAENYLLYNLEKQKEWARDAGQMLETLNTLGILYHKLNDLNAARQYMTEALNASPGTSVSRPYLVNNLGTIYMKQGNFSQAEIFFEESAAGFKKLFGSINPDYASSLSNLARIYKERGKLSKALDLYTKVLDMDNVIFGDNHPNYATTLNNVANLYLQLGNYSLAGKLLAKALDIRGDVLGKYHPLTIKTSGDLGRFYLLSKDTVSAMRQFDEALQAEIKHMQDIFPVLTDKQRQLYFTLARENVERFCSLAFTDSFINSIYAEQALNHFINTKGILFYASQKMRDLVQSSGDKGIQKIYDEWRDVKYKLAQIYLLPESERTKQNVSIGALEEQASALEKKLSLKFKVFADQEKSAYHTWREIAGSLEPGTATIDIVQYRNYGVKVVDEEIQQGFEDRSDYAAFIIKSDSTLTPVKWSQYEDFVKDFSRYRNSLEYGLPDSFSYVTFWSPLDKHLHDVQKIYFSPDGIFHKVNPSVFYDKNANLYVADKYDIINITSAKDLLYREERELKRDVKIFGNPDFSRISGYNLAQLPGAEKEAEEITNILDVRRWKTETHYFNEATEQRIKSLNNPGVVHIATHGYFEDDPDLTNPLFSSGLFLSRGGQADDGMLSAYEAMNLVLDQTKVVVLAACETGLGTVQNGEGVFGLQRAFLVAGSESVLISLVKINDQAARNFMNLFYEELKELRDPQAAFFGARKKFKEIDKNPYNWGAYVLVSKA
ncbi:MAG: CHAT domain-containing tetratricopeptide repeat protein [Bacteroidota bacterium]